MLKTEAAYSDYVAVDDAGATASRYKYGMRFPRNVKEDVNCHTYTYAWRC